MQAEAVLAVRDVFCKTDIFQKRLFYFSLVKPLRSRTLRKLFSSKKGLLLASAPVSYLSSPSIPRFFWRQWHIYFIETSPFRLVRTLAVHEASSELPLLFLTLSTQEVVDDFRPWFFRLHKPYGMCCHRHYSFASSISSVCSLINAWYSGKKLHNIITLVFAGWINNSDYFRGFKSLHILFASSIEERTVSFFMRLFVQNNIFCWPFYFRWPIISFWQNHFQENLCR